MSKASNYIGRQLLHPRPIITAVFLFRRHASLTSAIERGIRKSRTRPESPHRNTLNERRQVEGRTTDQELRQYDDEFRRREPHREEQANRNQFHGRVGRDVQSRNNLAWSHTSDGQRVVEETTTAEDARVYKDRLRQSKVPMAIPYTTAGSEFLYGTFAVKSAILSGRRKLYKLYIRTNEDSKLDTEAVVMEKAALAADVGNISRVGMDWEKMLSRMCGGRPHNGFVLEASRIPKLPVTALSQVTQSPNSFNCSVATQSPEDTKVNSCFDTISGTARIAMAHTSRFPFVLMLDRILDPGNLGAIIRSCHFLGVDALAIIDHGSAPFNAVTLKASAGAAEYLPLLTVRDELRFLKTSKHNGWKIFATDSVPQRPKRVDDPVYAETALLQHPCILLIGNEGEGLRKRLQSLADATVTIPNARASENVLDSLNVSVAAAVLAQRFLQNPDEGAMPSNLEHMEDQGTAEYVF